MCAKRWIFAVRRENFVLSPTRAYTRLRKTKIKPILTPVEKTVSPSGRTGVYDIRVVVVYGRARIQVAAGILADIPRACSNRFFFPLFTSN